MPLPYPISPGLAIRARARPLVASTRAPWNDAAVTMRGAGLDRLRGDPAAARAVPAVRVEIRTAAGRRAGALTDGP